MAGGMMFTTVTVFIVLLQITSPAEAQGLQCRDTPDYDCLRRIYDEDPVNQTELEDECRYNNLAQHLCYCCGGTKNFFIYGDVCLRFCLREMNQNTPCDLKDEFAHLIEPCDPLVCPFPDTPVKTPMVAVTCTFTDNTFSNSSGDTITEPDDEYDFEIRKDGTDSSAVTFPVRAAENNGDTCECEYACDHWPYRSCYSQNSHNRDSPRSMCHSRYLGINQEVNPLFGTCTPGPSNGCEPCSKYCARLRGATNLQQDPSYSKKSCHMCLKDIKYENSTMMAHGEIWLKGDNCNNCQCDSQGLRCTTRYQMECNCTQQDMIDTPECIALQPDSYDNWD